MTRLNGSRLVYVTPAYAGGVRAATLGSAGCRGVRELAIALEGEAKRQP